MYGTPHPGIPWPSNTVSTCFCRSMAIEIARLTLTSLKGGLSCARARPKGARVLAYAWIAAAELVFRTISASAGLACQMMSLCPERNAARRVAASGVRGRDQPHLARVLLQEVGTGADHALLQVAVLFEHLAGEDHRDGLRQVVREQHVGRLEMDAQGVPVGRLHPLDLAERERLHALLGIGLEAVLDVR